MPLNRDDFSKNHTKKRIISPKISFAKAKFDIHYHYENKH